MMGPLLTAVLGFLPLGLAGEAGDELAQALKKAGGWESYRFTTDEQPGPGTGGTLEAAYQKGKPLSCKADRIEFFKKGEVVAYREGDRWLRSRTGTLSDPLRVLGAVAKVRAVRLPHEEVAALTKAAGAVKKEKDGGHTVYHTELSEEAARTLARSEHRGVARGGSVRIWVGEGKLVKYTVTIKVQGRIGGADVDGTVVKTVTLSGVGSTEVTVPEGARKVLE
jgi:hypothetical protein